jgi:hypothetical protein
MCMNLHMGKAWLTINPHFTQNPGERANRRRKLAQLPVFVN